MGNLIQSIPVYKPVQQPVQVQKNPVTNAVNPAPFDKGPFADAPKYTYQPARPLTPVQQLLKVQDRLLLPVHWLKKIFSNQLAAQYLHMLIISNIFITLLLKAKVMTTKSVKSMTLQ